MTEAAGAQGAAVHLSEGCSVAAAVSTVAASLGSSSDTPKLDARALLKHALAFDDAGLLASFDRPLSGEERDAVSKLAARRKRGEPIAHITGKREFWSLTFRVDEGLLVPRPDSETVVEAALAAFPDRDAPCRVLDLGTGTGCLLGAFLSERPHAYGVGVDRNPAAARCAEDNLRALGLKSRASVLVGDWAGAVRGPFDLVIANPPYIKRSDASAIAVEARDYEDPGALFGGDDGLDAYRRILQGAPDLIMGDGALVVEIGWDQKVDVARLARDRFPNAQIDARADLGGRDRALTIKPVSGN